MINVHNLHKSYGEAHVLKGINLHVEEGTVVAIIGPSGSGKSTFLRCLNFLEDGQRGTIEIDGARVELNQYSKADIINLRKKTGMVFQNYNLFKNKTALQNIADPLRLTRRMSRKEAENKAYSLLREVGLEGKEHHFPVQLSGGQQQRVAIARALSYDPDIILADEPTGNLDGETQNEIMAIFKSLADAGKCVIIVTHSPNVCEMVDQIYDLKKVK